MPQILEDITETLKTNTSERRVEHDEAEGSVANAHSDIDVDERALLRKMDLHFIPWLSFLYFLSFLDRTSIGNARVSACMHSGSYISSCLVLDLIACMDVAVRSRKGHTHVRQAIFVGFDSVLYQLRTCVVAFPFILMSLAASIGVKSGYSLFEVGLGLACFCWSFDGRCSGSK